MKNFLCKIGIHKPSKYWYQRVYKHNGKHKWHTNYVVCERCGKRLRALAIEKRRGDDA